MARFQEMRVLLAVTEAESFAGGAKLLGISPPSVTRAIAALEARLGTLLLPAARAACAGPRLVSATSKTAGASCWSWRRPRNWSPVAACARVDDSP